MKKAAAVLFVFVLGVAAYTVYVFFFKDYDTADEKVDRLAEEEYQLEIPDGSAGQTKEEIISEYRPSYDGMMIEAEQRVDQIIAEAQQEYMTKVQNGEEISYGYFYKKYTSAADRLEERTDKAFSDIYLSFTSRLEEEGYGTKPVEDMKIEYEKTIESWRSKLMDSAKEAL